MAEVRDVSACRARATTHGSARVPWPRQGRCSMVTTSVRKEGGAGGVAGLAPPEKLQPGGCEMVHCEGSGDDAPSGERAVDHDGRGAGSGATPGPLLVAGAGAARC